MINEVSMKKFGEVCVNVGFIDRHQLSEALSRQATLKQPLGKVLLALGYITDEQLAEVLSIQLQLDYCRPLERTLDGELVGLLSARQAERFRVLPIRLDSGRLTLATAEPLNLERLDQLREILNYKIKLVVASETQVNEALKKYYVGALDSVATVLEDLEDSELSQYRNETLNDLSMDSENLANEAPIIRLVNTIINGAVQIGASDIHLEPFEGEIKVRYRVDGVLQETPPPPKNLYSAVVSRIKLMGGMDITERRIPQDGRIKVKINNRDLDLRVAVAPTLFGEAIVMRVLNRDSIMLGLEQLGFGSANMEVFTRMIAKPHGMILVTGPTGSGKTTTLYAALQRLNESTRKIITVEDPVEYQLKGINQMQVNPKLNFSFAQGLRTIVRLDPDIILVGEIRDKETAEVAIQAALTGHLVFATLHTNDAASAFTRLIDMGIEEFLVASTVHAVLAQRLIRRICPECRERYQPTQAELDLVNEHHLQVDFVRGAGCDACNHIGYRKQQGIFELLSTNDEIERLVMERSSSGKIREAAIRNGMITLRLDGLQKVSAGVTTLAEIIRVTRD
jgi:type II secretion system protein E